jgi:phenylacetate-CoA ligase
MSEREEGKIVKSDDVKAGLDSEKKVQHGLSKRRGSGFAALVIRGVFWPLMEKLKGNRVRQYLSEMNQFQYEPVERMEQVQQEKLEKLLLHSVLTVPAYQPYAGELTEAMKDTHWDPRAFMHRLPVLTKGDINDRRDAYLSSAAESAELIANRTGGSTGEPTRFYIDRFTVEHYEAARWRGLGWSGIGIGDPSVMIWGSSIELGQLQQRKFKWKERILKNRILLSAYDLNEKRVNEYLQQIYKFKPQYLYGYASALYLFADMILRSGRSFDLQLQAAVSTSETLHAYQRKTIEQAFGCKAVNEYGARDGGILAFECPEGHMHIPIENCHLEVVDMVTKQPLPVGEKGLLLVTDLNNFSMPRLRYELGDVTALSSQPCSCGINLPVMEHIEGRETDVFVSASGDYVYGAYFNRMMLNLNSFRGFQMIQHAPHRMTVKFIKHPERYDPAEEQSFLREIYKALGENIQLHVDYVAEIPRTSSGKLRYAIREFELR